MQHIQLRASLPIRSRVVKYRKSRREADADDAAISELYAVHKEVTALQKVAGVSSVLVLLPLQCLSLDLPVSLFEVVKYKVAWV